MDCFRICQFFHHCLDGERCACVKCSNYFVVLNCFLLSFFRILSFNSLVILQSHKMRIVFFVNIGIRKSKEVWEKAGLRIQAKAGLINRIQRTF